MLQAVLQVFVFFDLAFPDDNDLPAHLVEGLGISMISFDVRHELGEPVVLPRFWRRSQTAARMAMPKTPVYKNNRPIPW